MTAATMHTIDPATHKLIQKYRAFSGQETDRILELTLAAQRVWSGTTLAERVDRLRIIAATVRDRQTTLAERIVVEMGKPIREALGEVEKCAWAFEYYADAGPGFLRDMEIETGAKRSGYGRELGASGALAFANARTYFVGAAA